MYFEILTRVSLFLDIQNVKIIQIWFNNKNKKFDAHNGCGQKDNLDEVSGSVNDYDGHFLIDKLYLYYGNCMADKWIVWLWLKLNDSKNSETLLLLWLKQKIFVAVKQHHLLFVYFQTIMPNH